MADGSDFRDARDRAENITYNTNFSDGKLYLDSFLTSPLQNNYRDQEVRVVFYLPECAILYADRNISNFHRHSDYYGNILNYNTEGKYLQIIENGYNCEDCEAEEDDWNNDSWENEEEDGNNDLWEVRKDSVKIEMDENGIKISNRNSDKIRINKNGIAIQKS